MFLNRSRQYNKRQTRGEEVEDEGLEPTYYFSIFMSAFRQIVQSKMTHNRYTST